MPPLYPAVVGGVKLHYKDVGGGSVGTTGYAKDSALVLIHGFGAGVFAWRRVGPALAVRIMPASDSSILHVPLFARHPSPFTQHSHTSQPSIMLFLFRRMGLDFMKYPRLPPAV